MTVAVAGKAPLERPVGLDPVRVSECVAIAAASRGAERTADIAAARAMRAGRVCGRR